MWLVNNEQVVQGVNSARLLLSDSGLSPIKKMVLLKNLTTKLIPKSSLEERSLILEKVSKLCDTDIMDITQLEIDDLIAWMQENEELDESFELATRMR